MLPLATTGLARGDDSNSAAAWGVDYDQNSPQSVHAQGHEALPALGIWVFDRNAARVAKRLFRMRKVDPVLAKIGPGFGRIEFPSSTARVCISYAYCQAGRTLLRWSSLSVSAALPTLQTREESCRSSSETTLSGYRAQRTRRRKAGDFFSHSPWLRPAALSVRGWRNARSRRSGPARTRSDRRTQ